MRIAGLVLNLVGVLALWFGGVPYKERETMLEIGSFKATAEREKKVEIPQPVGAGCVAAGTALLLFASFGKKKRD